LEPYTNWSKNRLKSRPDTSLATWMKSGYRVAETPALKVSAHDAGHRFFAQKVLQSAQRHAGTGEELIS